MILVRRFLFSSFVVLVVGAPPVAAQIPEQFENLQVLPKDISRKEIVNVMRGYASGLGVRCKHCHEGPDNLKGMDFATDEKAVKRAAREMIKMTAAINETFLANLPARAESRQRVTCFTCHRRQVKPPLPLQHLLADLGQAEGAAAVLKRHTKLREKHLGDGTYDFGERTLIAAARRLAKVDKLDDALALLVRNLEHFPASANSHALIGHLRFQKGDPDAARRSLERALTLDPRNFTARKVMELLEKQGPDS